MDTLTESGIEAETLASGAVRPAKQRLPVFLLRLQESVRIDANDIQAVVMGTSTVTEVRREAADADPRSLSYFAIEREQ